MKRLTVTKPEGWIMHVTANAGAGKTTLIGDMLESELKYGPCAYLFTREEGTDKQGGWSVLPESVLRHENFEAILLETFEDFEMLVKEWKEAPRIALGIDTSSGLETLIRTSITGDPFIDLKSKLGDQQHKLFLNKWSYAISCMRDMAKYTLMVSPAAVTSYNAEKGENDTGKSGSTLDAVKRIQPTGENNKSVAKLSYGCDYAFHIERVEGLHSGEIREYILKNQPTLNMKSRIPLGKKLTSIKLVDTLGKNWEAVKSQIYSTFE